MTCVSVSFDDEAVADYFEDQVEAARVPQQFGRIWLHTHPGNSPEPSMTDENTFTRVFGSCDWAIMFIVAQDGRTFARLRFNAGPRITSYNVCYTKLLRHIHPKNRFVQPVHP